jgi:hypothetical protein
MQIHLNPFQILMIQPIWNSFFRWLAYGHCTRKNSLIHLLTELSPSWEAANCAATEELPSILWNPKVHHRVHKSPPLVPILNQMDPVHTFPSYLSKIYFNIVHTYVLIFLVVSFLLAFPSISYMHSSSPPLRATCPASHPPSLDHSNYIWRSVQMNKQPISVIYSKFRLR